MLDGLAEKRLRAFLVEMLGSWWQCCELRAFRHPVTGQIAYIAILVETPGADAAAGNVLHDPGSDIGAVMVMCTPGGQFLLWLPKPVEDEEEWQWPEPEQPTARVLTIDPNHITEMAHGVSAAGKVVAKAWVPDREKRYIVGQIQHVLQLLTALLPK